MAISRASALATVIAAAAGLGAFTQPAGAQFDHLDQFANPLPESGRWFTNDGSRTGFFIEVQRGVLAGLYVGGDAEGNNAWVSFSGVLQPGALASAPEGGWILETDLLRFAGTGCIVDCAGASAGPSSFEDIGDIRIDFLGRSLARVWIDDQPAREIAPIFFGVERAELNPQAPPLFLPDLAGKWVVAKAQFADFPDEYRSAAVIEIGERIVEQLDVPEDPGPDVQDVRYINSIIADPDGMFPPDSRVECITFIDRSRRPSCWIVYPLGPMRTFQIRFDSITDSRLTVIETGDVIPPITQYQLIKLNHD
ncbi:MAG: hypothetical protein CMP07_13705 [Xanthomonadales bacterium]|nr:hypothetical protein [Xanthomonadales bacterium]